MLKFYIFIKINFYRDNLVIQLKCVLYRIIYELKYSIQEKILNIILIKIHLIN